MSEENKNEQLDVFLTEIGDAIREVKSTTNLIDARDMSDIIRSMSSGSAISLQEKTITPSTSSQNVTPDSGYDGLSKVTVNAIPSTYVKPTATKGATTYTPNTSDQTIASGTYLSGTQTIKGDTNLVADNIKSGVNIFGVTGTYEGSGGGSVETCTVNLLAPTTLSAISYNTFVNGQFVVRYMTLEDDMGWNDWNVTLDNFVKGTCLTMIWYDFVTSITTSGAVQVIGRIASQSTSDYFYLATINGDCSIDMF